ncbi:MAG: calcium/sodium antiporter [Candidatus Omnitrophica bacterium]|nr:calcium/sodium antiporter [Candidatus Omnitrophota bacterium]
MAIFPQLLIFLSGLALLIIGAHWFIQTSVKFSQLLRLSSAFIGLIFVAFGTSAPEAGVGILAAFEKQSAIALGNIVGSNIANIGLILGLCALFTPLTVERSILRRETPFMIVVTVLLYIFSLDLVIQRWEGIVFILLFIAFCYFSFKSAQNPVFLEDDISHFRFYPIIERTRSRWGIMIFFLISLSAIIAGSYVMVSSGVTLAKILGISPWIIAMTMFAVGTSLPELAASLTAAFKKVPAISIGNIVGSNIFNIIFVLGIVACIEPLSIGSSALKFELPVLILFSILLFAVMKTKNKISRFEGMVLLLGYVVFLGIVFTFS